MSSGRRRSGDCPQLPGLKALARIRLTAAKTEFPAYALDEDIRAAVRNTVQSLSG